MLKNDSKKLPICSKNALKVLPNWFYSRNAPNMLLNASEIHTTFFTCGTQVLKQSFQKQLWDFEAPPILPHPLPLKRNL